MKAYDPLKAATPMYRSRITAVIGGGNVAMDAARMALRLGSGEVHVIYRRTRNEMPARAEEIEHAMEEGIIFHFLRNPVQFTGDDQGRVTGIELLKYELGEPDNSGRRSPVAIKGSEYRYDCDTVIVALGNESNPLISRTTSNLEVDRKGRIVVNTKTQQTSLDRVYAGGDIVLGAATVILAMGEGRRAAAAINQLLIK
jgi:glutamate synthase (NADPH/NADH) small chain